VVVELTARGNAIVNRLIPVALSLERSAISTMSARDLARIKRVLRRMHANLTEPNA
jgi:DNA-binding MarR family transcriptional regulator